jgi:hypothetical protein
MRVMSWVLRIYCGYGGMPAFQESGGSSLKAVAEVLGISQMADQTCSAATLQELLAHKAKEILGPLSDATQGEAPASPANWPVADCPMSRTMKWLADSAGLNRVEHDIFELAVAMRVFRAVHTAVEAWGTFNHGDVPYALSAMLNVPLSEAMAACNVRAD